MESTNAQEDELHKWRKDIEAFLPPRASVSSRRQLVQEPSVTEIRIELSPGLPFSLKLFVQPLQTNLKISFPAQESPR